MPFSVTVRGADEAQSKLSPDKVQGALQGAIEQIGEDLATPKGGGLGVKVNTLTLNVSSGLAVVESSLVWPRTTGQSWLVRSQQDGESVALIALEAAGEQLAQEMA
jgi:hypothetical protein